MSGGWLQGAVHVRFEPRLFGRDIRRVVVALISGGDALDRMEVPLWTPGAPEGVVVTQ